jgi:hypothetical protein
MDGRAQTTVDISSGYFFKKSIFSEHVVLSIKTICYINSFMLTQIVYQHLRHNRTQNNRWTNLHPKIETNPAPTKMEYTMCNFLILSCLHKVGVLLLRCVKTNIGIMHFRL